MRCKLLFLLLGCLCAATLALRTPGSGDGALRDADVIAGSVGGYTAEAEADRIKDLPGAPPSARHISMFSGCGSVVDDRMMSCVRPMLQGLTRHSRWGHRYRRHRPNCCSHPAACSYITVDEEAGRSLFYLFVESTHAPKEDPLVLWLNGGPGCSSLGGGAFSELGPFYPTPGGKQLIPNKFAWNQ